ncbi:MAG: P-loop guanosine triphosphatase YjiA [Hyphomicrobiaceae bacterium hypho_1]
MTAPIPVILVTGFLGTGKTTLINSILQSSKFAGTAVLVNEIGEISLDHHLIEGINDDMISTTTGCMCCTASSDVQKALFELWRRRIRREIPSFSRVIIETTGLVDPAPVIASLLSPPGGDLIQNTVITQFVLSRVVTLFDILHGNNTLKYHPEALKQIALADTIIFTKSDLAFDTKINIDFENIKSTITKLNSCVEILSKHQDWDFLQSTLLSPVTYDLRGKKEDALSWLKMDQHWNKEKYHYKHKHRDHNHHSRDIMSHCIILENAITPLMFNLFLDALKVIAGKDLLRMKGLFKLTDDPERPFVAHGVQNIIHPIDRLERWPSEDRRTRIILIGKNLRVNSIRTVLNAS